MLGAGLAAVMLLPLLEAIHQAINSSRSQPPLPARSITALFFPKYWGSLGAGPANFAERTMYAGALPLLLAAAGLVARRARGPQLFFAGLAVVSLAVALDTGPFSRTCPRPARPRSGRTLGRVLILASFAIAMLAAFGLQLLLNGTAAERRRMLIAAAVVAVLPALVVVGAHPRGSACSRTASSACSAPGRRPSTRSRSPPSCAGSPSRRRRSRCSPRCCDGLTAPRR